MALSLGELVAYFRADDSKLTEGISKSEKRVRDFGENIKKTLAVAGTAAAAALTAGIVQNLDIGEGRARLAAQLDLTKEDTARIGAVAGKVYAGNFGESLQQVNEAIAAINTNIGSVAAMSDADLQGMTQNALSLAKTFDVDVNDAARAAGKMISSGLAKDSQQAFDIMTRGFQTGLNSSGDFLDTLNEYSPQFAKLGIDGPHALNLLRAGLYAGARDTDAIADSFKEFSIRAIDGSTTTADGFKAIGLNAAKAAKEIGKGGPAAAEMTQQVMDRLLDIKDPIKQNAAGAALFGTQWEDTMRRVLPSLADAQGGMAGVEGATARMAETAGGSAKAKIETLRRSVEQWIQAQTNSSSALGTTVAAVTAFGGPGLAMAGSVGQIAAGMAAFNLSATVGAARTAVVTAGTYAWSAAQWVLNAALNANPLGLIVIAIVALVGALIYAWNNSETFRRVVLAAWDGIKSAASAVFGWLMQYIPQVWNWIKTAGEVVWNAIVAYVRFYIGIIVGVVRGVIAVYEFFRDAFTRAKDAVVNTASGIVDFVKSIPGRITGALGDLGGLLYRAGQRVISGLVEGIRSVASAPYDAVSSVVNRVKGLLPGSPVKDGPLRVLNRGYAGRTIVNMIAEGIEDASPRLTLAMSGAVGSIPSPRVPGDTARSMAASSVPGSAGRGGDLRMTFGGDKALAELFKRMVRVEFGGNVLNANG